MTVDKIIDVYNTLRHKLRGGPPRSQLYTAAHVSCWLWYHNNYPMYEIEGQQLVISDYHLVRYYKDMFEPFMLRVQQKR